jgi:hypothetical protein
LLQLLALSRKDGVFLVLLSTTGSFAVVLLLVLMLMP